MSEFLALVHDTKLDISTHKLYVTYKHVSNRQQTETDPKADKSYIQNISKRLNP